jgi:predicted RNase H-like HicB family nuclease
MKHEFIIEKAPNNYAAYVPDLPGVIATGKTREEVERRIREGIEIYRLDYAWEKLHAVVLTLAEGSASVRERVADAFIGQLIHLDPEDLPGSIQADFAALRESLAPMAAAEDEDRVAKMAAAINDFEAKQIAAKIVALYDEVARRYGWEAPQAVASGA